MKGSPTCDLYILSAVTDLAFIERTIPHQIKNCSISSGNRYLVVDTAEISGYYSKSREINSLDNLLEIGFHFKKSGIIDEVIQIDYQNHAKKKAYNNHFGRNYSETHCFRGYPYWGSILPFEHSGSDYIVHLDSDMLVYQDPNYNWIDDEDNVAKIIELINNQDIEQMQLQGGEPQLMKGFVDIITQIDSKKRSQIGLQVTTNASVFNEKFWEQAVKFQRVTAGISIDATGSRYDVIRYHGDWATTEKNCIKILDYLWTNRIDPGPNPALNLNIVLQLANVDQCDAMNSFYEDLQKRFPGLAFQHCLVHITDLGASNRAWDIQNLPLEILNSLLDIKADTQLGKQWREGINYAIENNGYNEDHRQQVLTREEHFLNVHGKNLWTERPDWFKIYNR